MGNAGICYFQYCSYLSHVMNSLKVCNILLQDWYFFAKSLTTNSHVNMRWYHCSNYYTITSQCQNQPYMVLQQLMLESRSYTDSILQCWHQQQYLILTFLTSNATHPGCFPRMCAHLSSKSSESRKDSVTVCQTVQLIVDTQSCSCHIVSCYTQTLLVSMNNTFQC